MSTQTKELYETNNLNNRISVPKGWKILKLGNVATLSAGGTPSTLVNEYWENGTIPWISSGELRNNVITKANEKITELGLSQSAAKIFPKGTLLIAIAGQGATRGRTALMAIEAATNQSVVGIVCNEDKIFNHFLWHLLQNEYWKLRNISQGSNRGALNLKLLNEYDVILPSIIEQKKIALILSNVDDLVQKTDEVIERARKLKKGLMHKLLTEENRTTKFKTCNFGEVILELKGGGTPSTTKSEYWNGIIPWTRSAVIKNRYVKNGEKMITKEGLENSATNLIPKDNLLIATRVSIGNVGINKIDIAISQDLTGIIIDRTKADVEYLYWFLLKSKPILTSLAQGSTIKGITKEDLKSVKLLLPLLSEQKKIASMLSKIDDLVQKTDEVIERARKLKKGLMQKLLTGKIRVKT